MLGKIADIIRGYIQAERDAMKRQVACALADTASRSAAFVLAVMFGAVGCLLFAAALSLIVAQWTGSLVLGLVIVGAVAIIVAAVVWMLRGRMMRRRFFRRFYSMLSLQRTKMPY